MADKFQMVDPTQSVYDAVQQNVNERLEKAVEEVGSRYARGEAPAETSERGPSGEAYQQRALMEAATRREQLKAQRDQAREQEAAEQARRQADEEAKREAARNGEIDGLEDEEDDDDALLNELDDDPELRRLRDARLEQMKAKHREKLEERARGHGQYSEVDSDSFLPAVTESKRAVAHFYHRDFERCKVMDHHLRILAQQHPEARFVRCDAEKMPFFISKLAIRQLPCILMFIDGVTKNRIDGFDGLCDHMPDGREDEWPTHVLARRLAQHGIIRYNPPAQDEGEENLNQRNRIGLLGGGSNWAGDEDAFEEEA